MFLLCTFSIKILFTGNCFSAELEIVNWVSFKNTFYFGIIFKKSTKFLKYNVSKYGVTLTAILFHIISFKALKRLNSLH